MCLCTAWHGVCAVPQRQQFLPGWMWGEVVVVATADRRHSVCPRLLRHRLPQTLLPRHPQVDSVGKQNEVLASRSRDRIFKIHARYIVNFVWTKESDSMTIDHWDCNKLMTLVEEWSALDSSEAKFTFSPPKLTYIHIRLKIPRTITKDVGVSLGNVHNI